MRKKWALCLGAALAIGAIGAACWPRHPRSVANRVFPVEALDEASGPSHTLAVGRFRGEPLAFIADEDSNTVLSFSLTSMTLVGRTAVPGKPSSVRRLDTGELAVTLRDQGKVVFLRAETEGLALVHTVAVCAEPVSTHAFGDSLFVVCAWEHALDTVSIARHALTAHIDLGREPRAVVPDSDGDYLYFSHAVGSRLSIVERATGKVREQSLNERVERIAPIAAREVFSFGEWGFWGSADVSSFGNDFNEPRDSRERSSSQGFSLAYLPDERHGGGQVFVPEVLVATTPAQEGTATTMRTSGYGFGGVARRRMGPALPRVASVTATRAGQTTLDSTPVLESRCLLPRAAVTTKDGRVLVACVGIDAVLEYDGRSRATHERSDTKVSPGPNGIAVVFGRAIVWSAFSHVLTRFDLDDPKATTVFASDRKEHAATPFELGRQIFHATDKPEISADGRACASCHPDGRDDGLVWSSPDGPRQTPTLAGRLSATAPFGWTGNAQTVRAHLGSTLQRLGGNGLNDKAQYALLTYLSKMAPPPAHSAIPSAESAIARGKAVFTSYDAGCSGCHDPDHGFTDGTRHDVGSKTRDDVGKVFETPSLLHVGGTAPYFHDGRFRTLEDLLTNSPHMADLSSRPTHDLEDLASYLRSL
jgi:mono/diheme cytochrome c family protein